MNIDYTQINANSGKILGNGSVDEQFLPRMQQPGELTIQGVRMSVQTHYYDLTTQTFKEFGNQPFGCDWDWSTLSWKDRRTLGEIKASKTVEVIAAFNRAMDTLNETYPVGEQQTWPTQEREAMAWGANKETPTPFVDALAAERGIDREEMLQKVLDKVNEYHLQAATLVGQHATLRQAITDAATPEEVTAIAWPGSTAQSGGT